ncbi:MAG: LPS export ABC transporter periplasmic protein LptC [Bacteroidota bacterium]|nr:LPS export ABC transporter periplasmic protein LptC [Bacteroidota bacterium]
MFQKLKYFFLIFFLGSGYVSFAQVSPPPAPPSTDTVREFEIIRGPSMRAIKIDSNTTIQTIAGGAIIQQGTTIFHSDSAVVNPVTHILEAFGNIEINQADTVHTYSQYLKYLGVEKIAYLKNKVKLTNKSGTLFTDDLDYNMQTGIGNFHNGGKIIEGKSVITSVEGTYYDDTKDIYFKKNVKLDEPQKQIRADSLLYNMQTRQTTFISPTNIKTPEVDINTSNGTYDLNTGNAFFTNRATVKDSSGRLYSANTMALENKTGNAQLEGNAVIIDSAGGYTIIANQVFMNKKKNSFLATRKPVLIIKQKNDSTYIAADTIFSGFTSFVKNENKVLQNDSTINVDTSENRKVQQTISTDTTEQFFLKQHPQTVDSTKKILQKDSSKIFQGIRPLTQSPPVQPKDTSQSILKKPPRDSLITKDSTKKVIAKSVTPDSLKNKMQRDSSITYSLPVDSTKKIAATFPDSLKTDVKLIKDSTNKSDTAIRYFLAFHHVKIFNDSLQSVCDSMFISSKDSTFRLYYSPVVWSGNTQIAGDTIFLYTKNKQPARLFVFDNGLVVNKTKEGFFNQMSGKTINGYFVDGKIDYMRVRGTQAQSIYYMQDDDSAYIGMNRAIGDVIDLYFKDDDLRKVLFINSVQGTMYPMDQIPEDQKKLKDFKWLDAERPKNRAELFE